MPVSRLPQCETQPNSPLKKVSGTLPTLHFPADSEGSESSRHLFQQAAKGDFQNAVSKPGIGQLQLSVTESAGVARSLYEAAGFRCWGREPRALACEGRFVDEFHLVLELNEPMADLPNQAS